MHNIANISFINITFNKNYKTVRTSDDMKVIICEFINTKL